MADDEKIPGIQRRELLKSGVRSCALVAMGGLGVAAMQNSEEEEWVWQVDPWKCTWCGKCATDCVLTPSAVKCLRDMPVCGYCEICTGYSDIERLSDDEGSENQLCPTRAITRILREYPYYEYPIDDDQCIGCAKCAEGCTKYGNGSMYMQIKHDLCVNCSECAIAKACPSKAIVRVPRNKPYLIKGGIRVEPAKPYDQRPKKGEPGYPYEPPPFRKDRLPFTEEHSKRGDYKRERVQDNEHGKGEHD